MKTAKRILVILMAVLMLTATLPMQVFAATQVTGISIYHETVVKNYLIDSDLVYEDIVLQATYSDGSKQLVYSGFTYSPTRLETVGDNIITVSYGGQTTTYKVNVYTRDSSLDTVTLGCGNKDAKYKMDVTIQVRAKNVPAGYWLVVGDQKVLSEGEDKSVRNDLTITINLGQLTDSCVIPVSISNGTRVAESSNGKMQRNVVVEVDHGLFDKISAFFGMIFRGFNWGSTTICYG